MVSGSTLDSRRPPSCRHQVVSRPSGDMALRRVTPPPLGSPQLLQIMHRVNSKTRIKLLAWGRETTSGRTNRSNASGEDPCDHGTETLTPGFGILHPRTLRAFVCSHNLKMIWMVLWNRPSPPSQTQTQTNANQPCKIHNCKCTLNLRILPTRNQLVLAGCRVRRNKQG